MLTTWDQRQRRDKIKVTRVQFAVPAKQDDLYRTLEAAITPQTRVLHICHVTNITGQLFPVQRLCRMARQRGITTIVDAAHSVAHFPFKLSELECDFAGTSLHKWLLAPHGTGLLYVRRDRIEDALAAAGRRRGAERQHPQVRAGRHAVGGAESGDRRSVRVSPGDRHREQSSTAALPDHPVDQPVEGCAEDQDSLEPRAGPGPGELDTWASRASRRGR